jgi:hypothetical protein
MLKSTAAFNTNNSETQPALCTSIRVVDFEMDGVSGSAVYTLALPPKGDKDTQLDVSAIRGC